MNEIYAVSPNACDSVSELRLLFSNFGPYSGRYILTYPLFQDWQAYLIKKFEYAGDIERERLKLALKRAQENCAFLDKIGLPWSAEHSWIENAFELWKAKSRLDKIFSSDEEFEQMKLLDRDALLALIKSSESEIYGSTDAQIDTTAECYWDAAKILCMHSHNIFIIDPYFNPLNIYRKKIFLKFLEEFSHFRKISEVSFFVRHTQLASSDVETEEIKELIKNIIKKSNKNMTITLNLVEDDRSNDKLHARYLVTNKGGLKFDQGFQTLPRGRKNVVSPIGKDLHAILYAQFSNKSLDFRIAQKIEVVNRVKN